VADVAVKLEPGLIPTVVPKDSQKCELEVPGAEPPGGAQLWVIRPLRVVDAAWRVDQSVANV
jgi:hypothetical protein